jgi:tRNA (adenine22-N1)-methyltransferase
MTAIEFVRCGRVFADIGTDHGYLPIYLYKNKIVSRAIAADINPMPLESARRNINKERAAEGIETVLSDGLKELLPFAPDDIAIFGMGGELVCKIIAEAPWTKDPDIRLILQPMTKQEEVRSFLLENGYSIKGETLSYDDGKFYQTLCAEYSGEKEDYTKEELILGKHNIEKGGELFARFVENRIGVYSDRLEGKRRAGLGDEEALLIENFKKILEEKK